MFYRHFIILFIMLISRSYAQVSITPSSIQKIQVLEGGGGLAGGWHKAYDVVKENGEWVCYRTSLAIPRMVSKKVTDWYEEEKKYPHKRVGTVKETDLLILLESLEKPVPEFDWRSLNITRAAMMAYADTASYQDHFTQRWGKSLDKYYTDSNIRAAILAKQEESWTDDGPVSSIFMILTNADTVKISSNRQPAYMLPWKVNGKETYDLNINRFFTSVIENDDHISNRARVSGRYFPTEITRHIYYSVAEKGLYRDLWENGFPDHTRLLKTNFGVGPYTIDQGFYKCTLTSNRLPPNMQIEAMIDLASRSSIEGMIRFRDSIALFVQKSNFVFRAYPPSSGASFTFPRERNVAPTKYLADKLLVSRLPALAAYDFTKAIFFSLSAQEGRSDWLLLPDNTLVLLFHSGQSMAAVPGPVLLQQREGQGYPGGFFWNDDSDFIQFDAGGKVMRVSKPVFRK